MENIIKQRGQGVENTPKDKTDMVHDFLGLTVGRAVLWDYIIRNYLPYGDRKVFSEEMRFEVT